jgi:hypothetical protein
MNNSGIALDWSFAGLSRPCHSTLRRGARHTCRPVWGQPGEHPFEGLSVQGCYALMRTLHFEVTGRQTERVCGASLDEIRCEHKVAAVTRGSLFNQVARSG